MSLTSVQIKKISLSSPTLASDSGGSLQSLSLVSRPHFDQIAQEEPLEIVVKDSESQRVLSITLRTPGPPDASEALSVRLDSSPSHHPSQLQGPGRYDGDLELVAGFLFHERLIQQKADLQDICFETLERHTRCTVRLAQRGPERAPTPKIYPRQTVQSSSCGACGKTSIESVLGESLGDSVPHDSVFGKQVLTESLGGLGEADLSDFENWGPLQQGILKFPDELRKFQTLFEQTGGVHGCGYFSRAGELLYVREDIGRHNALDKLIGRGLLDGVFPLAEEAGGVLVLSGRVSFELVQKALYAGIKAIAAVGAPSSMACSLAQENGIALIGFLRGSSYNVYPSREVASQAMVQREKR